MKLLLIGHTERYPVEQLQMQLFPDEPSEFVTQSFTGDGTVSSLSRGKKYLTATAKVTKGGKTGFASRRIPLEQADVRMTRRILQQSYYLAATKVLGTVPPWGALSGVRPTKLSTKCMLEGGSEKDAAKLLEKTYFVTPERSRLCVDASKHTLEAAKLLEPGDLSVYIGIPFCPTRCSYCSFVSESIERFGAFLPPYLEALHREIAYTGKLLADSGYHIRSLYMGGGTPTTLSAEQLDRLCSVLEDEFDLSAVREYTVEAGRPDTISAAKLRVLRAHGVDRVSVNPQTMSDRVLELIGRRHTASDIERALQLVREVGGFDVNMDLIAGLPGDSAEGFRDTVEKVLALGAENITVHTLSLKKGSRITLEEVPIPGADEVAAMLDFAGERLSAAGYSPYYLYRQKFMSGGFENVGWAKDGRVNLYNICIMEELCSIIAMGGGGSTKLIRPDDGRNIRIMAPKYPLEYINSIGNTCAEKVKILDFYNNIGHK